MKFKYQTKLASARSNSKSMRTTVPKEVVQFLNLSKGDNIQWIVDITADKEVSTTVKIEKI